MRPVTIIVNEQSGSGESKSNAVEDAAVQAGLSATIVRVPGADVAAAAERAAAAGHVVVAAGGDGTVSTVASVAVRTASTFGVIPLGTLNHFARDVGIPIDPVQAAAAIAAGHTRDLDAGEMNGSTFINNISLGLYPRLVWERQQEQYRGRGKWTAFAIALARTWHSYPTVAVSMTVDGVGLVHRTPFVFVGNGEYVAEGLGLGTRASLTSGGLSIFLAPGVGRFELLELPLRALAGRLSAGVKFESFRACEVVIDTAHQALDVAVDGELDTARRVPLRCRVRCGALKTIVPEGR